MEFANRICPHCKNPNYVVYLGKLSKEFMYKCMNCNAYFNEDTIVHPEPSCEITYVTDCCCDLCGVQLIREDNFCRGCGKPIDWNK